MLHHGYHLRPLRFCQWKVTTKQKAPSNDLSFLMTKKNLWTKSGNRGLAVAVHILLLHSSTTPVELFVVIHAATTGLPAKKRWKQKTFFKWSIFFSKIKFLKCTGCGKYWWQKKENENNNTPKKQVAYNVGRLGVVAVFCVQLGTEAD